MVRGMHSHAERGNEKWLSDKILLVPTLCVVTHTPLNQAMYWRYSSARNYLGDDGLLEVRVKW